MMEETQGTVALHMDPGPCAACPNTADSRAGKDWRFPQRRKKSRQHCCTSQQAPSRLMLPLT
eukprot:3169245-Lingulodinium_polyedra.AAC.1